MKTESYIIVRGSEGWQVDLNGAASGAYATKEAAFEAACAAASNAIKAGNEVTISVPGREGGESTLGTDWRSLS